MGSSGGSDRRIILIGVAMAIAGGAMLMRVIQGDGGIWVVISAVCAFVVLAVSIFRLTYRRL